MRLLEGLRDQIEVVLRITDDLERGRIRGDGITYDLATLKAMDDSATGASRSRRRSSLGISRGQR